MTEKRKAMTWEILAGLISLAEFLITFCTVVLKNTAAMTKSFALQE